MGWCHEFGSQIRDGCDHPMVAGEASCRCDECDVECKGKFAGCVDVWSRGPRPATLLLNKPDVEVRLDAPKMVTETAKVVPPPPERGPAPALDDPTRALIEARMEWMQSAFETLSGQIRVVADRVARQQSVLAEIAEQRFEPISQTPVDFDFSSASEAIERTVRQTLDAALSEHRSDTHNVTLAQLQVAELAEHLPDRVSRSIADTYEMVVSELRAGVLDAVRRVRVDEVLGEVKNYLADVRARVSEMQGEVTRLSIVYDALAAEIPSLRDELGSLATATRAQARATSAVATSAAASKVAPTNGTAARERRPRTAAASGSGSAKTPAKRSSTRSTGSASRAQPASADD